MSDFEDRDIEDEIPASRITAYEETPTDTNEQSCTDGDKLIEFLFHNDLDDGVIEYVDYSDDEQIILEDNSTEQEVKEEPVDELELGNNEERKQEMYHCNTCDVRFYSIQDHIDKYHQNQSVMIDDSIEEVTDNLDEQEIKEEHIDEDQNSNGSGVYECTYLQESPTSEIEMINEEKLFDNNGRSYITQKIRLYDGEIINASELQCANCKKLFNSLDNLKDHKCKDPSKNYHHFACPDCGNVFNTHRSLASHMRVHKQSRKTVTTTSTIVEEIDTTCEICNTTFPTMKSLKLHRRMHDPVKTKVLEDAIGYKMKNATKEIASKGTFFCDICNKSYSKLFEEIHKSSHDNEPVFVCSFCNKRFNTAVNLKIHMTIHQDQDKPKGSTKAEKRGITLPYPCSFCGRQFSRPHEKVKHERIHTGEKPYKCEICGKSFRVSYCLTLHLRTHSGIRPYVCPHCNKRFKAYSVYNHHLMTHSDSRPYKCPYCPKAFKTSVQLAGHKKSHTKPFTCLECNRPFASLYAVQNHMETHKKGGPNLKHRCGICGAFYARVFALRDHMKEQHLKDYNEKDINKMISKNTNLKNENIESTESVISDHEDEEITIGEIENFQTEEVVTDWLK